MKKWYSPVVLTVTCLLGLGMSARAQDVDKVTVNVPFEFVAGGQTLPAGTYTVSRVSDQTSSPLVIRSPTTACSCFLWVRWSVCRSRTA